MIPYIGDVSRHDAELLASLARHSSRILEFGVGASTQIFAAYGRDEVHSVDTSMEWIQKTIRNLDKLDHSYLPSFKCKRVAFHAYTAFVPTGVYDLVFVDGLNELRLPFALKVWPFLGVGGRMAFHDTRRTEPYGKAKLSDVQHVCAVLLQHWREVRTVEVNMLDSNTTVVTKRAPLLLEDYNKIEGRTRAQLGLE